MANKQEKDEEIIILRKMKQKPNMTFMPKSNLLNRTQSLLTEIKRTNEELTNKINKMGKESVIIEKTDNDKDDGKDYINLDLFLGILEEKKKDNDQDKQSQIQSTTDKLLGINKIQNKKSIIMKVEEVFDSDSDSDRDQDIDLL